MVLGILPGIYFPWIEKKGDVNIWLRLVDRYGCIEYLHVLKVSYIEKQAHSRWLNLILPALEIYFPTKIP